MKKAVLIVTFILLTAIICTVCFSVAIGSSTLKTYIDTGSLEFLNDLHLNKAIGNCDWDAEGEANLRKTNSVDITDFDSDGKLTIKADVCKIYVVPSMDVNIHAQMNVYCKTTNYREDKFVLGKESNNTIYVNCDDDHVDNSAAVLKVEIPADKIKNLNLEINVGDVRISDIDVAELSATVNVGNMEIKNSHSEKASFKVNTGDLDLSETFTYSKELSVSVDVGAASLSLPRNDPFRADYKVSVGELDFDEEDHPEVRLSSDNNKTAGISSQGTLQSNDGSWDSENFVKISLDCSMGSIKIDK